MIFTVWVTGARNHRFPGFVPVVLDGLLEMVEKTEFTWMEVVHGDSGVIDKAAKQWAIDKHINHKWVEQVPFPPDWETHGKAAGPMRNKDMADYLSLDPENAMVLAFPQGESRGTRGSIKLAKERDLKVVEVPEIQFHVREV